jgi:hypothetical protein
VCSSTSYCWLSLLLFVGCHSASAYEIAQSEIVATSNQDGLQYISSGRRYVDGKTIEEDYAPAMDKLLRSQVGASNALIVDATTINDAVKATARTMVGFRSADRAGLWSQYADKMDCGSGGSRWKYNSIYIPQANSRLCNL